MPYNSKIITSIYGRRLGLQGMSTAETGGPVPTEFLVGPDSMKQGISTAPTTATAESAAGISNFVGTSAASTPVFTLAPPIPGVAKTVNFSSTDSALYVKMTSGCAISGTSLATTGCTVIRSSGGGCVELIGLTTALYGALSISSTGVNTVGFQATT